MRSKYSFGAVVSSDFTPGSRFEMRTPDGDGLLGEGENIEVDPPRRLVQTASHSSIDQPPDIGHRPKQLHRLVRKR
jgi:uncharacterized protein YndB with AHSA1/START domain